MYRSKLDPEKDLKGATPETLALALLRPRKGGQAVVGGKVAEKQVATDKADNHRPHLRKRI